MKGRRTLDEWSEPPADFGQVLFDRTDRASDERRYYQVSWEPTLLDEASLR